MYTINLDKEFAGLIMAGLLCLIVIGSNAALLWWVYQGLTWANAHIRVM